MAARLTRNAAIVAWLPVGVLPPLLVLDAALTTDGPPVTVVAVLAAVVGCLPLVLRGRLPFVALAPLLTAGIVLVLWQLEPGNTVVLIPIVALAELATRGDRRSSLWIGLAVVPCVVVSVLPFADDAAEFVAIVVRNFAFSLLALAAGDVVRSRREAGERTIAVREGEALRRLGEERLRIARDVHDVVAHAMVAINVQAGVAAHLIDRDPDQARPALREIKAASGAALTDLRATLGVLRDPDTAAPVGPASGLNDLEELAAGLRTAGVRVTLDVEALDRVPVAVHAAGYRIVQEALTNVLRHAQASAVRVSVAGEDAAVRIEGVDDGTGAHADGGGSGNGVRGMRERAEALSGTLESGPATDGGWRVRARLPIQPAGVGAAA
ncbi:MAG: sensor histidine kinase [Solirubrobacteraceae bacterium]